MSFPLTSDGAAIAQFLRQLEPNDMPVGGTATARALERGREVLPRDPEIKGPRARDGLGHRRRHVAVERAEILDVAPRADHDRLVVAAQDPPNQTLASSRSRTSPMTAASGAIHQRPSAGSVGFTPWSQ